MRFHLFQLLHIFFPCAIVRVNSVSPLFKNSKPGHTLKHGIWLPVVFITNKIDDFVRNPSSRNGAERIFVVAPFENRGVVEQGCFKRNVLFGIFSEGEGRDKEKKNGDLAHDLKLYNTS